MSIDREKFIGFVFYLFMTVLAIGVLYGLWRFFASHPDITFLLGLVMTVSCVALLWLIHRLWRYQHHELPRNRAQERAQRARKLQAFVRLVRLYGNNIARLPIHVIDEMKELARVKELRVNQKDDGELELSIAE